MQPLLTHVGSYPVRDDAVLALLARRASHSRAGAAPAAWPHFEDGAPSLPDGLGEGEIRWAPGARDGVTMYHTMPPQAAEVERHARALLEAAREAIRTGDTAAFEGTATEAGAVKVVDAFLDQLTADDTFSADDVATLAARLLAESALCEPIKLAISATGVLRGGVAFEPALRLFAIHDEFTLFASLALVRRGAGGEDTWLAIARRVRGWGRVHAVARLCDVKGDLSPATERWLLEEGCDNDVLPAYSALRIAERIDVLGALSGDVDEARLSGACKLLEGLLDEGPCPGISSWDHGPELCALVAEAIARAPLSPSRLLTLQGLGARAVDLGEACAARVEDATSRVFARRETEAAVRGWLRSEDAAVRAAARALVRSRGGDTRAEALLEIERAPHGSAGWYEAAEGADEAAARTLADLARVHLDPPALATGPAVALFSADPRSQCFEAVLQALARAPAAGLDLLTLALRHPVIRARNMALRAIAALPLSERPATLREALAAVVEGDPTPEVRAAARRVAEGRPFDENEGK